MATATKTVDYDAIRIKWQRDVGDVVELMRGWFESHPTHPKVNSVMRESVTEPSLGTYVVPGLDVVFKNDFKEAITVDSAARNFPGRGFITITSWPNLRRVYLVQNKSDNNWTIYTDSNIPLRLNFNEDGFHTLIDDLLAESP